MTPPPVTKDSLPPRSPGRAGPPSLLPLPPPTPGRCAWQPPGRISWHSAENKQHSAPVIPLPWRPRFAGGLGRSGGGTGRGLPGAHAPLGGGGGGGGRGGGGAGRESATTRAPRGHSSHCSARAPAVSGSDSSWPCAASEQRARPPGGAQTGGGGSARAEGAPGTRSSHPRPRASPCAPVRVVPHPADFGLCSDCLCGCLSRALPLTGTTAVPAPNTLTP